MSILSAQADTRKSSLFLTPLKTMDEVLEQEYRKGEVAGLEFASKFVEIQIQILREQIEELTQEVEKDEQNSDEVSANGVNSGDGRLSLDSDNDSLGTG